MRVHTQDSAFDAAYKLGVAEGKGAKLREIKEMKELLEEATRIINGMHIQSSERRKFLTDKRLRKYLE